MMTEIMRYCPTCGSAHIQFSELVGTEASCNTCNWKGLKEELYDVPFSHSFRGKEGLSDEFANEVRRLMENQDFAVSFIKFLVRWGFITSTEKATLVAEAAKYMSSAARAIANAVVAVRANTEKEKVNEPAAPRQ